MSDNSQDTQSGNDQPGNDNSAELQQQIEQAVVDKTKFNIVGNNTKSFLGVINDAPALDVSAHSGVVSYEPTELVITARAGTTLREINTRLSEYDQTLAFEPPAFGSDATLGGTVACALAGPAKPYLGGTRDYILGCKILNGKGQILQFGGEVMKNVAGYDVSRLMTGAMGTLGLLLDISVKVLPKAKSELTLSATMESDKAIEDMQALAALGLPITASAYIEGTLYIRLSGTETAINAAANKLESSDSTHSTVYASDDTELWTQLKEHTHPFFQNQSSLWRISVPALTKPLDLDGTWLYDWAGTQRWLFTDVAANAIRSQCESAGGHATLYRGSDELKRSVGVFHPLPKALLTLQQRLKHEFDPQCVFNHQRLFPDF